MVSLMYSILVFTSSNWSFFFSIKSFLATTRWRRLFLRRLLRNFFLDSCLSLSSSEESSVSGEVDRLELVDQDAEVVGDVEVVLSAESDNDELVTGNPKWMNQRWKTTLLSINHLLMVMIGVGAGSLLWNFVKLHQQHSWWKKLV